MEVLVNIFCLPSWIFFFPWSLGCPDRSSPAVMVYLFFAVFLPIYGYGLLFLFYLQVFASRTPSYMTDISFGADCFLFFLSIWGILSAFVFPWIFHKRICEDDCSFERKFRGLCSIGFAVMLGYLLPGAAVLLAKSSTTGSLKHSAIISLTVFQIILNLALTIWLPFELIWMSNYYRPISYIFVQCVLYASFFGIFTSIFIACNSKMLTVRDDDANRDVEDRVMHEAQPHIEMQQRMQNPENNQVTVKSLNWQYPQQNRAARNLSLEEVTVQCTRPTFVFENAEGDFDPPSTQTGTAIVIDDA